MQSHDEYENHPSTIGRGIIWIWRLLPSVLVISMITVIIVLSGKIKSKAELIKTEKESQISKEVQVINVETLKLYPVKLKDTITFPGIVQAWVALDLLSEVNGTVVEKRVIEGRPVQKNEMLVQIDARDYENAYNSAKAAYDAANASLLRIQQLYKDQFSTRSQLDEILAQVENYRAQMDTAKLNVERCRVKAPIDGIVNHMFVEEGQLVNMSTKLMEILQIDKIKVKVGIPESDVDDVRRLDTFQVTIDALSQKVFTGKKYFLSKTADTMARLYDLVLVIDNSDHLILPDMFARVEIVKKQIPDAIAVPIYSVISIDQRHIVYVEKDKKASLVPVSLGIQEKGWIQIKQGLNSGDHLIMTGNRFLAQDQPVNVIRSESQEKFVIQ
ncbi:MAG: efflux RND transporter periplasmic adaptor subunit [Desulfobacterales bacterium]|nr:efflux RND transporter periplasmic adaptor subunit [Desulfobacterales bacterium]